MSLINCPECGREISDETENCPSCGFPIKPHKSTNKIAIGVIAGICGVIAIFGVFSGISDFIDAKKVDKSLKDTSVTAPSKKSTSNKSTPAFDFKENTGEELSRIPDEQGLISLAESDLKHILVSIGVSDITEAKTGNFIENSGVYSLNALAKTENGTSLLIDYIYISMTETPSWEINSVADYYTGNYYYVIPALSETIDLYDYTTGELLSRKTKEVSDIVDQNNDKVKNAEEKLDELLR